MTNTLTIGGKQIELTDEEVKKIMDAIERIMWECPAHQHPFYIDSDGTVRDGMTFVDVAEIAYGDTYESREEAETMRDKYRELQIINQMCLEENKRTGFKVDWGDTSQDKNYIYYCNVDMNWKATWSFTSQELALVHVNRESAERIVKLLNEKRVRGITR